MKQKVDTPYKNSWADQQNRGKYAFKKPVIDRLRIRGFRVRLADLGKGKMIHELKEV